MCIKLTLLVVVLADLANVPIVRHKITTSDISYVAIPFAAKQVWSGSYVCAQGKTSLNLEIIEVSKIKSATSLGRVYKIKAIFNFDFGRGAAVGKYSLNGKYDAVSKVAHFFPSTWIKRPKGFRTVGMRGLISKNGNKFVGKIVYRGCGGFEVLLN